MSAERERQREIQREAKREAKSKTERAAKHLVSLKSLKKRDLRNTLDKANVVECSYDENTASVKCLKCVFHSVCLFFLLLSQFFFAV